MCRAHTGKLAVTVTTWGLVLMEESGSRCSTNASVIPPGREGLGSAVEQAQPGRQRELAGKGLPFPSAGGGEACAEMLDLRASGQESMSAVGPTSDSESRKIKEKNETYSVILV